jgi:hypothetical protein
MHRWIKIVAAVVVLVCVLAVFISPAFDLPDSVMRGAQALVFVLLAITAMVLCGWLHDALFLLSPEPAVPLLVFDPDRTRSQRTC